MMENFIQIEIFHYEVLQYLLINEICYLDSSLINKKLRPLLRLENVQYL
jgi:hypothetical protein